MEINLTPDEEAQLSQLASHEGKPIEQLLTECAAFMLRENGRFLNEVDEGIAAADRGEFLSEEEMDAFVDDILKS
jgi:predicted transcriptional regulator